MGWCQFVIEIKPQLSLNRFWVTGSDPNRTKPSMTNSKACDLVMAYFHFFYIFFFTFTAARLVTGNRRQVSYEIFIGYRTDRQRAMFKTAVLMYQCQHGMVPLYFQLPSAVISQHRALWSTDCSTYQNELQQPQFRRTRTSGMQQSSRWTSISRHFNRNIQT